MNEYYIKMLIDTVNTLEGKINNLSSQLNESMRSNEIIKNTLLSMMLMNLESYCSSWLCEERYNNIPAYIKRTQAASELFDAHIRSLHVKERREYEGEWCLTVKDKFVFMFIVPEKFHVLLCDDKFRISHLRQYMSLDMIFSENDKIYKIGDNIPIKLYDSNIAYNIPRLKSCKLTSISDSDDGYIILQNMEDKCFYKISLWNVNCDSEHLYI
jgi:hypothetical protein